MINWLITKIRDGFKDKSIGRLVQNYLSLSVLQAVNYLLPLITIPYLVRVLGADRFGLVMFATAFTQYFLIVTDYGFSLSATKEISVNRDDSAKVSEIYISVMIIKIMLLILSIVVLSIIVFSLTKFRSDWRLYYFTFGIVLGNALFPIWFFQGMEKMKYITILNIISRILYALLIFGFVRNQSDYILVPIFNSLGYMIAAIISIWIILRYFKVRIKIPNMKTIWGHFKSSTHFFLSQASVAFYTTSNTFIIGLFLGNAMAGYYAAAEKLFTALRMLYTPLNTALYPYMCKTKNNILYRKIFKFVIFFNSLLSVGVFIVSGFIVNVLYGDGFAISADLLRIFSGLGLVMVPAILLGYPLLAAMGYPKAVNYSTIVASIFHIILLISILPIINIYLVAAATIATQLVVIGIRIYAIKKYLPGIWETSLCAE